jgi:hypothetical protein
MQKPYAPKCGQEKTKTDLFPDFLEKSPIICFKIKNPPPVELCWQKKTNP